MFLSGFFTDEKSLKIHQNKSVSNKPHKATIYFPKILSSNRVLYKVFITDFNSNFIAFQCGCSETLYDFPHKFSL